MKVSVIKADVIKVGVREKDNVAHKGQAIAGLSSRSAGDRRVDHADDHRMWTNGLQ